jgi:tetratricopeptide (TPR) repeat protein
MPETSSAGRPPESRREPPPRFSRAVALGVGLAALLLITLVSSSSLQEIGFTYKGWWFSEWILPGFLVGWASSSRRRLMPFLLTLLMTLFLLLPGSHYYFPVFLLVIPLLFLGCFALGVAFRFLGSRVLGLAFRRLSGLPDPGPVILAVLASGIGAVLLFLWYADGWRYVVRETHDVRRILAKSPAHFFLPTHQDWVDSLTRAAKAAISKGDRVTARAILRKAERAARLFPRFSYSYEKAAIEEIARAAIAAGDEDYAAALLVQIEPDEQRRRLVTIGGLLDRGDFVRARPLIASLSERGKAEGYASLAEAAGDRGRFEDARQAIQQLSDLTVMPKDSPPERSDAVALVQARSGLYQDALETIRRDPAKGLSRTFEKIRTLKDIARIAVNKRQPDQARMIFAETLRVILGTPDRLGHRGPLVYLARQAAEAHIWDSAIAAAAAGESRPDQVQIFAETLRVVSYTLDRRERNERLVYVAGKAAEAHLWEDALMAADRIDEPRTRESLRSSIQRSRQSWEEANRGR